MQHTLRIPNGLLHYSTSDAVFRDMRGKPVTMEFHRYCGPFFFIGEDEPYFPDVETPEGKFIWDQFDGWWEAKGKKQYH